MSRLSTGQIVLGLLVERPGYGYDLQKRLDARLGFLALSESVVYRALDRLEAEGWIEEVGDRGRKRTRRGAARLKYRATPDGVQRFRNWIASPSDRAVLRDELQAKLVLVEPRYVPDLLRVAERQQRECLAELSELRRPSLAQAASPEVAWRDAAAMMIEDVTVRWLQSLVDWLGAICDVMEERIARASRSSTLTAEP
jgi:DNA-binding PadR family transcriptional regulator